MQHPNLAPLVAEFMSSYDASAKDAIWEEQSRKFREFWSGAVMAAGSDPITDAACDEAIRILDRSGKGNTKTSEAIARVLIAQGAWRRMLNSLHANKAMGSLVDRILCEESPERRAALIDELYEFNQSQISHLTGPSGNAVCALLAAFDPFTNLSIISLNDRRALIEFLELPFPLNWDSASVGQCIVTSNRILLEGLRALGVAGTARTASVFCYFPPVKSLWKGEHTIQRLDQSVSVTVPDRAGDDGESPRGTEADAEEIRESMQIQAMLAKIGASMGFSIWLPKPDRGRVLKIWRPEKGVLLESLTLGFDVATIDTIALIDVLWLRRYTIVRAFEVEHTTAVYSGLLRMADLVALQPNIDIDLHIVAPEARREKVFAQLRRPAFQLFEGRNLSQMCTYLSYGSIREIAESKHLGYLRPEVIEDYEQEAE